MGTGRSTYLGCLMLVNRDGRSGKGGEREGKGRGKGLYDQVLCIYAWDIVPQNREIQGRAKEMWVEKQSIHSPRLFVHLGYRDTPELVHSTVYMKQVNKSGHV